MADSLKERIEHAVAPLVGMPLWDSGRAADLEWFIFGEHRTIKDFRGEPREVGEYSLHVQCAWRITQGGRVLVGSRDLYYPAGYRDQTQEIPRNFNWDVQGGNRRDELIAALFEHGGKQYRVTGFQAGAAGAITFALENDMALEIFPDDALPGEHWRLFRTGEDDPHFVVTGRGIEE
ncbi:MAG: hypothetical protein ACHP79_05365 [Terriglobales bacterium]